MSMSSFASYVLHTQDIVSDVTMSKIKSNLKIAITGLFFSNSEETKIVIYSGSLDKLNFIFRSWFQRSI